MAYPNFLKAAIQTGTLFPKEFMSVHTLASSTQVPILSQACQNRILNYANYQFYRKKLSSFYLHAFTIDRLNVASLVLVICVSLGNVLFMTYI